MFNKKIMIYLHIVIMANETVIYKYKNEFVCFLQKYQTLYYIALIFQYICSHSFSLWTHWCIAPIIKILSLTLILKD